MEALVIEGKKKGDLDIFITLAKKLGLKVRLIGSEESEIPNDETIKAILESRSGKGTKAKNASDLMKKLSD